MFLKIVFVFPGSETAEDIAARMNIPEDEVREATAAVVHGSKLKVIDGPSP